METNSDDLTRRLNEIAEVGNVAIGDTVTVVYPGSVVYPTTTRLSVIKYISPAGKIYVRCVDKCGACGSGEGDGNHRLGMFGSRIVPSPPASERNCLCGSPAECAKAFPAKCPF